MVIKVDGSDSGEATSWDDNLFDGMDTPAAEPLPKIELPPPPEETPVPFPPPALAPQTTKDAQLRGAVRLMLDWKTRFEVATREAAEAHEKFKEVQEEIAAMFAMPTGEGDPAMIIKPVVWTQPADEPATPDDSNGEPVPDRLPGTVDWRDVPLSDVGVPAGACALLEKVQVYSLRDYDTYIDKHTNLVGVMGIGDSKAEKIAALRMSYVAEHGEE